MTTEIINYLYLGLFLSFTQILFAAWWWKWTINRSSLWIFKIPYSEWITIFQLIGLFTRTLSLLMFKKKWLINRKLWLWFLPWSIIGGIVSAYIILLIPEIYFTILMIILLFLSSIWYMFWKFSNNVIYSLERTSKNKIVWYILFIIWEAIWWITWWSSILTTPIMKHYFSITTLETIWLRKVFLFWKWLSSLSILVHYWSVNYTMLTILLPFSLIWSYMGTKMIINKGNDFSEKLMVYSSFLLWIYLLYTVIFY